MYITDGEEHDGMTLHIINKIGGYFEKTYIYKGEKQHKQEIG